jgi:hypothetical protein
MPPRLGEREIKLAIIEFLVKKGRWGAHYFPLETLVNWFSKKIQKNGKVLRRCIKSLIKEGIILLHKKGNTISLNPVKIKEIRNLIKK